MATQYKHLAVSPETHRKLSRIANNRKWSLTTTAGEAVKCLEERVRAEDSKTSNVQQTGSH